MQTTKKASICIILRIFLCKKPKSPGFSKWKGNVFTLHLANPGFIPSTNISWNHAKRDLGVKRQG